MSCVENAILLGVAVSRLRGVKGEWCGDGVMECGMTMIVGLKSLEDFVMRFQQAKQEPLIDNSHQVVLLEHIVIRTIKCSCYKVYLRDIMILVT